MASIVTEMLYSAGQLEKESIEGRIEKLSKEIEDIKIDVHRKLVSRYEQFSSCLTNANSLTTSLESAVLEVDSIVEKVEKDIRPEIRSTTGEFKDLRSKLDVITALAVEVEKLVEIHKYLEESEEAYSAMKFETCAESLEKVSELIRLLDSSKEVEIIEALRTEYRVQKEKLSYRLSELWKQYVVWKVGKTPHITKLAIAVHEEGSLEIVGMIRTTKQLGRLKEHVSTFSKSFMKNLVEPLLKHGAKISKTKNVDTLALQTDFVESQVPDIKVVLENLISVFDFLGGTFFRFSVDDETLLSLFGSIAGKELTSMVIKSCLEPAVPSEGGNLNQFPTEVLKRFHNLLLDVKFLLPEESEFTDFTSNLESLCINKMSQEVLKKARNLMKKELHVTTEVGEVYIVEESRSLSVENALEGSPFRFPKCQVSASTTDLVKLLRSVIQEASTSSPPQQTWHMYTVRNICELYCDVILVYHQYAIDSFPQQSAVHHNNCMYLAHVLLMLGTSLQGTTLVDLAVKLRQLGTSSFLSQMNRQKQQLLDFLQEVPSYEIERGEFSLKRVVRQCLHHLLQLKRLWSEVLPVSVFLKAIGTLLNTCIDHIICHVIAMEDISDALSKEFVTIFDNIITESTDLFDVPGSPFDPRAAASNHVAKWKKFCELQKLLDFNLRNIVERWADGKGPLAMNFIPDEVKRLIRALFQNTDRRAAALAKIR